MNEWMTGYSNSDSQPVNILIKKGYASCKKESNAKNVQKSKRNRQGTEKENLV